MLLRSNTPQAILYNVLLTLLLLMNLVAKVFLSNDQGGLGC